MINLTNLDEDVSSTLIGFGKENYFSKVIIEVMKIYSIDEEESVHILSNAIWLATHVAIDAKEHVAKLIHSGLLS